MSALETSFFIKDSSAQKNLILVSDSVNPEVITTIEGDNKNYEGMIISMGHFWKSYWPRIWDFLWKSEPLV